MDPISAANAIGTEKNGVSNASAQFGSDVNFFLKIFLAQLDNQDPTEPVDTKDMTEQMFQLSGVQQAVKTNENLDKLISLTSNNQISSIVSYTGKTIEARGNLMTLDETGEAKFAYMIEEDADQTFITIRDSAGNPVFNGEGEPTFGRHNVVWDRQDNDGNLLPAGTYIVQVTSKTGEAVKEVPVITTGVVTGVNFDDGDITLSLDGIEIPLDDVIYVGNKASFGNSTADDSGNG